MTRGTANARPAHAKAHSPSLRDPVTVLITGATGGIGTALARCYAQPHRKLILHGRDPVRLDALARECEGLGAKVQAIRFDLRDGPGTVAALRDLCRKAPIDLVIVNAGVTQTIGKGEATESWVLAREVLAVNLDGALATVAGVLPDMRRRQAGQIALVSSLAAWFGLPVTPTYCASKAALKAYGEALRGWLAPQGIAVNVVLPGFVRTSMSDQFAGPRPALMEPERVARHIRRGLERNQARIAFPRALAWGMWCLAVLPAGLSQRIVRALGYGG